LKYAPASWPHFKEKLAEYLRPLVIKGVPSVINELKSMYRDEPEKAVVLCEVLTEMSTSMEKNMKLN